MSRWERERMQEPLFCPACRGIPAPSAKNSQIAGGKDNALAVAGFVPARFWYFKNVPMRGKD
jgi:hypothetical protein